MGQCGAQLHHRPRAVQPERVRRAHFPLGRPSDRRSTGGRQQRAQSSGVPQLEHRHRQRAIRPAEPSGGDADSADNSAGEVLTMRRFLPLLLCAAFPAAAQQAAAAPQDPVVFHSETRLVVEQVTVKDKSGKPVEGLTAKDFTVTENGIPQTVAFLEFQKLEEIRPAPTLVDRVAAIPRLAHTQIAAERPLDLKYAARRLLALYFDMPAMPPADQSRAIGAAQNFIRKNMTPADLMRSEERRVGKECRSRWS